MKAEIGKKYTPTETIHHFGEDNFALFKDEEFIIESIMSILPSGIFLISSRQSPCISCIIK